MVGLRASAVWTPWLARLQTGRRCCWQSGAHSGQSWGEPTHSSLGTDVSGWLDFFVVRLPRKQGGNCMALEDLPSGALQPYFCLVCCLERSEARLDSRRRDLDAASQGKEHQPCIVTAQVVRALWQMETMVLAGEGTCQRFQGTAGHGTAPQRQEWSVSLSHIFPTRWIFPNDNML